MFGAYFIYQQEYLDQLSYPQFEQILQQNKPIPSSIKQQQKIQNFIVTKKQYPKQNIPTYTMIIQPQHHHNHSASQPQQPQSQPESVILSIFDTMLQISQQKLHEKTYKEVQRLKRYEQEKVYLSYCDDPSQYLLHMLHKSQSQNSDQVAEMIMGRQNKVVNAIKNDKYQVKFNNQGEKLKKIKDELASKIVEMRNNFANLETPQPNSQEKTEEIYKGFMQFRKKGYWNEQSEQAKKARRFLNKMRKQKQKISKQHEKNLQRLEEIIREEQQQQKKEKQNEHKKLFQQMSKKREKINSARKFKAEQHKKKLMQANSFVQKYRSEKPVYIINEQKFKKQVLEPIQEEKKRKLSQIKKNRRPIDAQQLELHQQRYEEFKQKLLQVYERRQQDNQLYQKNMQKLKQLYHGHYHEKIQEEMNNFSGIQEQKRKFREKINTYSAGVKQQFKPRIDNKKRSELESLVKLLQNKSLEKGKKKVRNQNGSIQYLEISPDEHKKLGISYLQHLKKYNEGKKRKQPSQDRSASMMDLSKKKIVYPDYLQQMRSKSRIETASTKSRHGWRKIISQQGFSNRDKYNSVMDHVSLLEHQARQKQLELKYMKGGSKALELKQKLDKYYLQSVAAKMTVLKDVILKQ